MIFYLNLLPNLFILNYLKVNIIVDQVKFIFFI